MLMDVTSNGADHYLPTITKINMTVKRICEVTETQRHVISSWNCIS